MQSETPISLLTSDDCRQRASDCIDAAFGETSSDTRSAYINLAAHWFKLAEEARLDERTYEGAASGQGNGMVH
jgi:hypothetical protein